MQEHIKDSGTMWESQQFSIDRETGKQFVRVAIWLPLMWTEWRLFHRRWKMNWDRVVVIWCNVKWWDNKKFRGFFTEDACCYNFVHYQGDEFSFYMNLIIMLFENINFRCLRDVFRKLLGRKFPCYLVFSLVLLYCLCFVSWFFFMLEDVTTLCMFANQIIIF